MGRLLIGVLSTGIYCLPSCTARSPKPENVRFFQTEAEAQAAGLRPCKRCHPDYFYRDYDPDYECLIALTSDIQHNPAAFGGLEAMANASGIGVTKLHALFRQHFHTTPAAYLSRARLATATEMLTDPDRQIIDVAYAAGYESLSAFHENFRKGMGLSPKEYQKLGPSFTLTLPKNYLSWIALKLLARDPESRIEQVNGNQAVKALNIGETAVLLRMEWQDGQVCCQVDSARPLDTRAIQSVHAAAIRMLGVGTNPPGFERLIAGQPELTRLIDGRGGLHIPLSAEIFEGIAWAILGQQVNLAFTYKLRRSLTELCGRPVSDGFIAHPTAQAAAQLAYEDLTQRQFSRRKAEYLIDTARLMVLDQLILDPLAPASQIEKQLLAVRGFGKWSTNYIMMRVLGFADCVPLGDTGLTTALQRFYALDHRPDVTETTDLMKPFAPYRSLATYHLWTSLGGNPA